MDLVEIDGLGENKHPWEASRIIAVRELIKPLLTSNAALDVMDVGCGDGFASRELFGNIPNARVTCVDIHLSDGQIESLSAIEGSIVYQREYPPAKNRFDLIIMLDVLEHELDDNGLLSRIASEHLAPGGSLLVTVPAFQSLFSDHDLFLKHHRRYNRREVNALVSLSGLTTLNSGYLFGSLLFPRLLSLLLQRVAGNVAGQSKGVGAWNKGPLVTKIIELALRADNAVLFFLCKIGVILPGLSVWALCKKQSS